MSNENNPHINDAMAGLENLADKAPDWAALIRGIYQTYVRALLSTGFTVEEAKVLALVQTQGNIEAINRGDLQ